MTWPKNSEALPGKMVMKVGKEGHLYNLAGGEDNPDECLRKFGSHSLLLLLTKLGSSKPFLCMLLLALQTLHDASIIFHTEFVELVCGVFCPAPEAAAEKHSTCKLQGDHRKYDRRQAKSSP